MKLSNILNFKIQGSAPKSDFQNDINGLRGISVLLVVLYHFNIGLFAGGFVGVDIFFVISGFLMTKIIVSGLIKNSFNYYEFILRRALRIFPALFFLILCLLILGIFLLPPTDLKSLAEQSLHAVVFNSNNYFAGKQGYFTAGADDQWLLHTWSLSVEWQFYMLYPAIIWMCFSLSRLRKASYDSRIFNVLLVSFFLGSLLYCILQDSQAAFFSVLTRAWQMIAGGLVYLYISNRLTIPKYKAQLSYAGFAVIVLSVFIVRRYALESLWPSYFAILPVAGACVVLLASYENNLFLNNMAIQNIGKWSYSIYLWHWPIVVALTITSIQLDYHKLSVMVGFPLSILLGYLSYKFIEKINYFKATSKVFVTAKFFAVASILLLISYGATQTNGFITRVGYQEFYKNIATAESSNTYDVDCENKGRNDRFCIINPTQLGKKLLVLGDSHAGHLYPWFLKNSKVNTTFYVKSGCPMIVGFETMGKDKACREYTERALNLAESGEYQTVIISQNWSGFSSTATGICTFQNDKCVAVKESNNPFLPLERTKTSLLNIINKNVKLLVLDATPSFYFSIPKKLSRSLYWTGSIKNNYDVSSWLSESAEYDQLFEQLKNTPNFNLVSLRSSLCKKNICSIYDEKNNIPIFKDHDHFNPAWIAKNGDVFLPYVQ